jgi:hypothetical protein
VQFRSKQERKESRYKDGLLALDPGVLQFQIKGNVEDLPPHYSRENAYGSRGSSSSSSRSKSSKSGSNRSRGSSSSTGTAGVVNGRGGGVSRGGQGSSEKAVKPANGW